VAFTEVASQPYLYLVLDGLGPPTDTTGAGVAYRFSTYNPGFAPAQWAAPPPLGCPL